jgi:hypothetical protein
MLILEEKFDHRSKSLHLLLGIPQYNKNTFRGLSEAIPPPLLNQTITFRALPHSLFPSPPAAKFSPSQHSAPFPSFLVFFSRH